MLNGIGKLSSVSTTNVCRRDRDVLLNTRDDELQIRVPLILKTKLTSILPPYKLRVWGSSLKKSVQNLCFEANFLLYLL